MIFRKRCVRVRCVTIAPVVIYPNDKLVYTAVINVIPGIDPLGSAVSPLFEGDVKLASLRAVAAGSDGGPAMLY